MPRRAMPSRAAPRRAGPAARPSPRVSLEGPREPAQPRTGGAARRPGVRGGSPGGGEGEGGPSRVPAAGTARRLPARPPPLPPRPAPAPHLAGGRGWGDAGGGTACARSARLLRGREAAGSRRWGAGAVPRGEPRRGVRGPAGGSAAVRGPGRGYARSGGAARPPALPPPAGSFWRRGAGRGW